MPLLVKCLFFQEEVSPPSPPLYLPLLEVAPELLEVVQGQASPMLGMGHLVNVPKRGAEALPSPSSPPRHGLHHIPQNTVAAAHRS